jgi:hypothetical protein
MMLFSGGHGEIVLSFLPIFIYSKTSGVLQIKDLIFCSSAKNAIAGGAYYLLHR